MNLDHRNKWLKNLVSTFAIFGVSTAIGGPVWAQYYYPGPSFWSPAAFYYDRGDLIKQLPQLGFGKFYQVLQKVPELGTQINQSESLVIFAPNDAAFEALPPETLAQLMQPENKQKLAKILSYHLVPGTITDTQMAGSSITTLEGHTIKLQLDGTKQISVNNAKVVAELYPTSNAKNGKVFLIEIDKVLIPEQ